jgi:hypothetical protein
MKKGFIVLLVVLVLGGSFLFASEETTRLNLSATISESPDNSGIRIIIGDPIANRPDGVQATTHFDNVFTNQAENDLTIEAGDAVMFQDVSGDFTVLVKRGERTPIAVDISGSPMQNEDGSANYIGYQIKMKDGSSIINTLSSPSSYSSGISYTATSTHTNNNWIRDTKVLEYKIPKNTTVPYGKYTAHVYFTITLE